MKNNNTMGDSVVWLLDSGCGNHISRNPSVFRNLNPVPFLPAFITANGSSIKATHIGTVGSPSERMFLPDAFLVPELKCNLVSVGQLCSQGARLMFSESGCVVENSAGEVVGWGHKAGNHFVLDRLNMCRPEENMLQPVLLQANDASSMKNRTTGADEDVPIHETLRSVPNWKHALRWIESELMDDDDDRDETPDADDDDLFLIDLEVYQHALWTQLTDN